MRTKNLEDFCTWLEQTPLSESIQQNLWVVPAIQTVHILSIAALFVSVVLINLRLMNLSQTDQSIAYVFTRFGKIVWWSLPLLLLSGGLLIVGEPARSLANDVFQFKMLLLVSVVLVTVLLQKPLATDDKYWESTERRQMTARILAIISMSCWVSIICAGRWIAYTYT